MIDREARSCTQGAARTHAPARTHSSATHVHAARPLTWPAAAPSPARPPTGPPRRSGPAAARAAPTLHAGGMHAQQDGGWGAGRVRWAHRVQRTRARTVVVLQAGHALHHKAARHGPAGCCTQRTASSQHGSQARQRGASGEVHAGVRYDLLASVATRVRWPPPLGTCCVAGLEHIRAGRSQRHRAGGCSTSRPRTRQAAEARARRAGCASALFFPSQNVLHVSQCSAALGCCGGGSVH